MLFLKSFFVSVNESIYPSARKYIVSLELSMLLRFSNFSEESVASSSMKLGMENV